jgi:hypothetical protein
VAFRPTIARGLALSQNMIQSFFYYPDMSNFNAKGDFFNQVIDFKGSYLKRGPFRRT